MRRPLTPLLPTLLLYASIAPACAEPPSVDELDSSSSGMMVPTDEPAGSTSGDLGDTSGTPSDIEASGLDGSTSFDGSTGLGDSSSGSAGEPSSDACSPFLDEHHDDEQRCGLTEVDFEYQSAELDFAAQCQLRTAAPCIADHEAILYLESHCSWDEADDADPGQEDEFLIALSRERGNAVETFLVDVGVPTEQLQIIAKGRLEASPDDQPEQRRVVLLWDE